MDRVIRQSVFALVGRPPPLLSYWWARSINYSTAPRGNQTYVFPAAGKTQKERKKKEMYIYILYICYTARACSRSRDTPCLPPPTAASRADLYHFIWAIRSGTGPFIPRRCWGSPALHFFFFFLVIADKSNGKTLCGTEKEYNIKVMSIFWLNGQKTFI